jgi:hypothetical protein
MRIDREMSAVRRGDFGKQAMTLLLVIAFALQSFVTQTHIHGAAETQSCISNCVSAAPGPQSPFDERADCPFCQAIVHAGVFFAPAVLVIPVRRMWVSNAVPTPKQNAPRAIPARNGFSRAPPR